ncbi:hypothetical protein ACFQY5_40455 [Paeniroseomonas aquatica]|uniref:hypothetical protein n=1 Tax=Paeniroseomonas aquatica TaxID=373043 RepID=UPI00361FE71E
MKTGKRNLRLEFVAALHPIAARDVKVDIRVAMHHETHLIGTYRDTAGKDRTAIIRDVDFAWLTEHCGKFLSRFPPQHFLDDWVSFPAGATEGIPDKIADPQDYLRRAFGANAAYILSGSTETAHGTERLPMPARKSLITLDLAFSAFDSYLIRRGFSPIEMENKWFIYFKDSGLFLRRSWTGRLIYHVAFQERGDTLYASHAHANRDPEQWPNGSDEYDRRELLALINILLLNKR